MTVEKLPYWFRQDLPEEKASLTADIVSQTGLHTVCLEAKCPNISSCFKAGQATFLILGDTCTRNCSFCAVKKNDTKDKLKYDLNEPAGIAEVAEKLKLNYVVITSVTRDDLEDGGAEIFAQAVRLIRAKNAKIKIELLIPDFNGKISSLQSVLEAGCDCLAHNLETVERLYSSVRPDADYRRSLMVLGKAKEISPLIPTKSSLMLGMGEKEDELASAMKDLRAVGTDILTLGQYLAPSSEHYPVKEFVRPAQFEKYSRIAKELGFAAVLSGPLVRSSYKAEEIFDNWRLSYV